MVNTHAWWRFTVEAPKTGNAQLNYGQNWNQVVRENLKLKEKWNWNTLSCAEQRNQRFVNFPKERKRVSASAGILDLTRLMLWHESGIKQRAKLSTLCFTCLHVPGLTSAEPGQRFDWAHVQRKCKIAKEFGDWVLEFKHISEIPKLNQRLTRYWPNTKPIKQQHIATNKRQQLQLCPRSSTT